MAKQTIDELAVIITANASSLGRDLDKAKKDLEKFGRDVAKPPPPPKPPDMSGHKKAVKEAADARSAFRAATGSVLEFAGKAAVAGGTLLALETGLSGVAGAFEQMKQSVRMAADFEQTTVSFEVMLGSAEKANKMLADIRQYAATTPFNNNELVAASRQLVAYGFSARQVMPTLQMLGDVSAAVQKPIGELAYVYGTLRAQGRAYQRDINQFTGPGIPIVEELAAILGKSQAEVRGLTENGQIEFRDVELAFKRMTSEGGRYFNMTARQGQTLGGVLEQTADAFDLLKLEFGKVLVDELGIKDAAKDLEAFAGRLRDGTNEIRPAVKFAGDLAKAGAQIGYEFGRAAVTVASLNLRSYADALPGFREIAASVEKMVEDAAGFKLDEKEVIRVAFAFGNALSDTVVNLGKDVGAFGEGMAGLFEWVVRSAREARDYMKGAADWLNAINGASATKILLAPITAPMEGAGLVAGLVREAGLAMANAVPGNRRDGAPLNPPWDMPAPLPGMSPDRIRQEYKSLTDYLAGQKALLAYHEQELAAGRGDAARVALFRNRVRDAEQYRTNYEAGFEVPAPPPAPPGRPPAGPAAPPAVRRDGDSIDPARPAPPPVPPAPPGRKEGDPIDPAKVAPPVAGMADRRTLAEWAAANDYVRQTAEALATYRRLVAEGRATQAELAARERDAAAAHVQRFGIQSEFAGDPIEAQRSLDAGRVPPLRPAGPARPPVPPVRAALEAGNVPPLRGAGPKVDDFLSQLEHGLGQLRGIFAKTREWSAEEFKAANDRRRDAALAAADARVFEKAAREAVLNAVGGAAAAIAPKGPFPDMAAWNERDARTAAGGPAGFFALPEPRQEISDLGRNIRQQYDPRPELELFRKQLDELRQRQLMGPNTNALVERAWRDRLADVGGKLGIEANGRYQLPDAVEVGSREDARIITSWRTQGQGGGQTAEQLLQQILLAIQQQTAVNAGIGRDMGREMPRPRVVSLPGE